MEKLGQLKLSSWFGKFFFNVSGTDSITVTNYNSYMVNKILIEKYVMMLILRNIFKKEMFQIEEKAMSFRHYKNFI